MTTTETPTAQARVMPPPTSSIRANVSARTPRPSGSAAIANDVLAALRGDHRQARCHLPRVPRAQAVADRRRRVRRVAAVAGRVRRARRRGGPAHRARTAPRAASRARTTSPMRRQLPSRCTMPMRDNDAWQTQLVFSGQVTRSRRQRARRRHRRTLARRRRRLLLAVRADICPSGTCAATIVTDGEGRYEITTIQPAPYQIPTDGPTGWFIESRPAAPVASGPPAPDGEGSRQGTDHHPALLRGW